MSELVTFFSHIPKTAGSTLLSIIRSQYSSEQILHLENLPLPDAIAKVREIPEEVRMITGHTNFVLRNHISRPFRSITVLRDPVEKILSLYYYVARFPNHRLHAAVVSGQMKLLDVAGLVENRQIVWLSGQPRDTKLPPAELLSLAKQNLVAENVEFGLTERFDETLILFSRMLNWNVDAYVPQNVTVKRPTRDQITAADRAALEEISAFDMELYTFACERFQERIAKQPPGFAAAVAHLRRRTTVKRVLHAFASRLGLWRP